MLHTATPATIAAHMDAFRAGTVLRETYTGNVDDALAKGISGFVLVTYENRYGVRCAVLSYAEDGTINCQMGDYHETVTIYEEAVRAADTGEFNFSDVPGVSGYQDGAEKEGNARGYMQDAEKANFNYECALRGLELTETARRIAIARAVDAYGRGGQTALANRLNLKQPTVRELAMRGRIDTMRAKETAAS